MRLFIIGFSFISLLSCKKNNITDIQTEIDGDSIMIWIQKSKDTKSLDDNRKRSLLNAYVLSKKKDDTIKIKYFRKIAYEAYKLEDFLLFQEVNNKARQYSIKAKDTISLADTHWNDGLYYSKKEQLDSAYYHYAKAYKYFDQVELYKKSGMMLYDMAIVQKDIRDYTGSEITLVEAIKKFDENDDNQLIHLYKCYNLFGVIYNNLREYQKALEYHDEALKYLARVKKKKIYQEKSLNNIALVHQKAGNYDQAINQYNKALSNNDSLYFKEPEFYAKLLDNLNYTIFLKGDTIGVEKQLLRTLRIRDSLKSLSGIVINKLHLSEFYLKRKDTGLAKKYVEEAYQLAVKTENNRDVLKALLLLSKTDSSSKEVYLNKYIQLNEELQVKERKLRNKFTRIRFETDEYIKKADYLDFKVFVTTVIGIALVVILLLLYFVRHQRAKNRELTLEREQQLANEEIYQLMLRQQTKLEEGRLKERHRISEELHDGVLGKIFGTRMGLGFLDYKGNPEEKNKHQYYIDELQEIEKEIRIISHELKNEILGTNVDYIKIVEDLVDEQSKISIFKYSIVHDGNIQWSVISDIIKINIYRVVQEALQNINKHANANTVSIEFSLVTDQIKMIIKDDGVGFDQVKKANGIGLKNITSRITKLKGKFTVESKPNKGTVLTISVPI